MINKANFKFVSKYADCGLELPRRETANSAGYDLQVAEDIVVPRYEDMGCKLLNAYSDGNTKVVIDALNKAPLVDLDTLAKASKASGAKPTLVPTGVKCYLNPDEYLKLVVRSSTPLKYWLILANGVGKIQ